MKALIIGRTEDKSFDVAASFIGFHVLWPPEAFIWHFVNGLSPG